MKIKQLMSFMLSTAIVSTVALSVPFTASVYAQQSESVVIDLYSSRGMTLSDAESMMYSYRNDPAAVIKLHGVFNEDKTVVLRSSSVTLDASDAVINSKADLLFDSWVNCSYTFKGGTWNLSGSSRLIKLSNSETQNRFEGMTINGGGTDDYGTILLYGCEAPIVQNCTFNNTKGIAVHIHHCPGVIVADNTIKNSGAHAIYLYGGYKQNGSSTESKTYGCTVVGNNITGVCGDGIKCVKYSYCSDSGWLSKHNLVTKRQYTECNITGNNVTNVKLNNNLDYDPYMGKARSGVGIMIMECNKVNIGKSADYGIKTYIGNSVKNTENYGMHINLAAGTNVEQTYFTDIHANGIHNSASSGTVINSCGFTNCYDRAIFLTPGSDSKVAAEKQQCYGSVIKNNNINKCASFGIEISKSVKITIEKNAVLNCKDYGIYCVASRNVSITGNSTGATKSVNGSGINYNSECSGITISGTVNIALNLDKTAMSLGTNETFTLKATVSPSFLKDKTVKWRTSNPKIVTVTQNGFVTAKGTGTAWVTASITGGIEKSCKITVKSPPSKISLSKGILTIGVGEKYSVVSSINEGSACAKRTYRTSNSSIVRMTRTDWQGDFVGVKPGIAYVTVRSYNGKESTCRVTVKAAPKYVTISRKNLTLRVGQSASLSAYIASDAGCATRTFRTSNSNIVKMTRTNWTGEFKSVKPGTAYVTVRTYNGKESSCKVTVTW